jgi:hypothetical protein
MQCDVMLWDDVASGWAGVGERRRWHTKVRIVVRESMLEGPRAKELDIILPAEYLGINVFIEMQISRRYSNRADTLPHCHAFIELEYRIIDGQRLEGHWGIRIQTHCELTRMDCL